ncbi:putative disease resistance RPP8-like protein 4 [Forsythia ovata]|uniref:Disease resistance RPP8-like protein 4 n=1 Tax=Forsythia ovata TaxID=205694 RepID=A0ABD1R4Z6_9LAMI
MAYAALRSLAQILHQTLNHDHQYLILDEKQQIESLIEKVSSIQDFLVNSTQKIEHLERKIRDVSHIAEDIIESRITDRILSESATHEDGSLEKKSIRFDLILNSIFGSLKPASRGHCHVVSVYDFIAIKARLLRESSELEIVSSPHVVSVYDFIAIKARLLRESSELEIVSIVGTGGIGRTTLATQVYHDSFIVRHFAIRAWATVSHDYNLQEMLLSLLNSMGKLTREMHEMTSELLEERLYECLKYGRYLIVLVDVRDTKFWDDVKQLFPNGMNGSRIMMMLKYILEDSDIYYKIVSIY